MAESTLPGALEQEATAYEIPFVFPSGLPGFANLRRFRLVADAAFSPPFELLESEEEPSVGFYLVDPTLIDSDYDPTISDADRSELAIREGDDVWLRAIVTVGRDARSTTANLAAPVVLNVTAGLGCQAILEGSPYALRTPLVPAEQ